RRASWPTPSSRPSRPSTSRTSSAWRAGSCTSAASSSWPTTSGALSLRPPPSAPIIRPTRSPRPWPRLRSRAMAFGLFSNHGRLERHSLLLVIFIVIVVSIGGLIEIAPLFYLESTIEKVDGMRPYTPLELEGRDIYIREGCYLCHSQMI